MTGAERALLALEMSDQLLAVAMAGQAQRHPDLSPAEQRRALIRLMHRIDVPAARAR